MKKYKEIFIAKESRTEIDIEEPFWTDGGDEPNDIEYASPQDLRYADEAPSMDLDEAIGILQSFKNKGCDRVYIATHTDHQGYYFYGVKFEELL